MNTKIKIKMAIDVLMTVFLLMLMAYQITGEMLHEWIGAGMLVLFLVHNMLNIRWYGSLFKGKYKPLRILRTVINFAVLAAMLIQAYSGIVLSRHVFYSIPISRGMALARVLHLAGAYWGFVLMSIHLGLHWGMITGRFQRLYGKGRLRASAWHLRLPAAAVAGYGAFCFCRAGILSYMFLQVEFVFFDYEKSGILVFSEYIAMMGLWVFIAYYAAKAVEKISAANVNRKGKSNEEN